MVIFNRSNYLTNPRLIKRFPTMFLFPLKKRSSLAHSNQPQLFTFQSKHTKLFLR